LDTVFSTVFIKESIERNEHTIAILGFAVFAKSIGWCSFNFFFFLSYVYITHAHVSSIQWKHHRENEFYEIGRKFAANSGLYWCYIAISSKGSKCTRPFALFNLKGNDFIRKKRTITLDAGECPSLMKPAEETNW